MTVTFYCYKDLFVPEYVFNKASNETKRELFANGWEEVEWDLIDCLKHGWEPQAVMLYSRMHNVDIKKSKEMVRKIAHDVGLE